MSTPCNATPSPQTTPGDGNQVQPDTRWRTSPLRNGRGQARVTQNSRRTVAARAGSWSIHQWPSPSRAGPGVGPDGGPGRRDRAHEGFLAGDDHQSGGWDGREIRTPLPSDVNGRTVQVQDAISHGAVDVRCQVQGRLLGHPEHLEDTGPFFGRCRQLLLRTLPGSRRLAGCGRYVTCLLRDVYCAGCCWRSTVSASVIVIADAPQVPPVTARFLQDPFSEVQDQFCGAGGYPGRTDRRQGLALRAPHSELTTASRFRQLKGCLPTE